MSHYKVEKSRTDVLKEKGQNPATFPYSLNEMQVTLSTV